MPAILEGLGSQRVFADYPPMLDQDGKKYRCVLTHHGDDYMFFTTKNRVLIFTDETLPDPIKIALGFIRAVPCDKKLNYEFRAWYLYENKHSKKLNGIGWFGSRIPAGNPTGVTTIDYYVVLLTLQELTDVSNGQL